MFILYYNVFLNSKIMNALRTMFKTLVSLFPQRDSIFRTFTTGEPTGLGC